MKIITSGEAPAPWLTTILFCQQIFICFEAVALTCLPALVAMRVTVLRHGDSFGTVPKGIMPVKAAIFTLNQNDGALGDVNKTSVTVHGSVLFWRYNSGEGVGTGQFSVGGANEILTVFCPTSVAVPVNETSVAVPVNERGAAAGGVIVGDAV